MNDALKLKKSITSQLSSDRSPRVKQSYAAITRAKRSPFARFPTIRSTIKLRCRTSRREQRSSNMENTSAKPRKQSVPASMYTPTTSAGVREDLREAQ